MGDDEWRCWDSLVRIEDTEREEDCVCIGVGKKRSERGFCFSLWRSFGDDLGLLWL